MNDSVPTATIDGYGSALLKNHLELLDKVKNDPDKAEKEKAAIETLTKTLEEQTKLPSINARPVFISDNFDKDQYGKDFLRLFSEATSSGMGGELYYFISQVSPESGEILGFAPSDKAALRSIADSYETFGKAVQRLKTPTEYVPAGESTTKHALETAYILRQMLEETDTLVYSTWFEKYSEATGYIYKKDTATSTLRSMATTSTLDTLQYTESILQRVQGVQESLGN
jgi:hypothetical protein